MKKCLNHKNYKEQIDRIERDIKNNTFWNNAIIANKFSCSINRPDVEMLDAVMYGKRYEENTCGTFDSADIYEYISKTMQTNIGSIVSWVENDTYNEFYEEMTNFYIGMSVYDENNMPKVMGRGFIRDCINNTIKEYATNSMKLQIQKNEESPYGFILRGVFPDLLSENVQPTYRDLRDIIVHTNSYQQAWPIQKNICFIRSIQKINIE